MHVASHLTSCGLRYANISQLAETQSVRSRSCRGGRFSCVKCLASGDAKRCHGNCAQLTEACSDGSWLTPLWPFSMYQMPPLENAKRFPRCEAALDVGGPRHQDEVNAFIATVAMLFLLRGIT
jgi:hypothetical protein